MNDAVASKYKVPEALRPLLESFTRETLRNQPADLVHFGGVFFATLKDVKKANPKSEVIGDDKVYPTFRTALQRNLRSPDFLASKRDSAQRSDRRQPEIVAQRVIQMQPGSSNNSRPETPEEAAATKIQAVYRGHFVRNHPEKFGIDTVDLTRRSSTDRLPTSDNKKDLKRHSVGGYSLEAMGNSPDDRAATRIQAEIRGYLARKHVEAMKQKNSEAATKIQAHIRGFLTRKKLHDDETHERSIHAN